MPLSVDSYVKMKKNKFIISNIVWTVPQERNAWSLDSGLVMMIYFRVSLLNYIAILSIAI